MLPFAHETTKKNLLYALIRLLDLCVIVAEGLKVNFQGLCKNSNRVVGGKKNIIIAESAMEKECSEAAEVFCVPVK